VKAFSSLIRLRIRPLYMVIAGIVAIALVIALFTFLSMRKTIALSVDGNARQITTYAASVGDLLEDEGIELREHDVVAPGAETQLQDGLAIAVRYAQQLNLEIDGEERPVWTTAATAEEALAEISRRGSETAILASRSDTFGRRAIDLPLELNSQVLIIDAGEETPASVTTASTVGELFDAHEILLGIDDEVTITSDREVDADVVITITRIYEETRVSTKKIEFESKTQNDSSLYKGEKKVVTKGKNGKLEQRHWVRVVDGEDVDKELLDETVIKKPVDEVIAVGTKARPAPKPKPSTSGGSATKKAKGSTDSLNWGALAQCESGGSATIVSSNGLYHGLYQFSVPTWKSVGGTGLPSQAPASEQTARAKMLYERSGAGPWPVCGKNLFR